jgi:hypothetical protein
MNARHKTPRAADLEEDCEHFESVEGRFVGGPWVSLPDCVDSFLLENPKSSTGLDNYFLCWMQSCLSLYKTPGNYWRRQENQCGPLPNRFFVDVVFF